MKMKQIYICETCGKESEIPFEIEACEANHLGLTVEELHAYHALQSATKYFQTRYLDTSDYGVYAAYCEYSDRLDTFMKEHHLTKPITNTEVGNEEYSDN